MAWTGRATRLSGDDASGLDEEAGEEQTPIPGPAPHARCESLTRLGTPAQTYSRRKRQRIGELLESPAQPSRRNPADSAPRLPPQTPQAVLPGPGPVQLWADPVPHVRPAVPIGSPRTKDNTEFTKSFLAPGEGSGRGETPGALICRRGRERGEPAGGRSRLVDDDSACSEGGSEKKKKAFALGLKFLLGLVLERPGPPQMAPDGFAARRAQSVR